MLLKPAFQKGIALCVYEILWVRFLLIPSSLICSHQKGNQRKPASRLALVCLVQYMEELTDRQAADAVRSRMDSKYVLGWELIDPGFDLSVLVPRFALAWLSIKRSIVSSSCWWQS